MPLENPDIQVPLLLEAVCGALRMGYRGGLMEIVTKPSKHATQIQ